MYPDSRFGYWNSPRFTRSTESKWRIKEFLAPVTTKSGHIFAGPVQPYFCRTSQNNNGAMNEEVPEIGSLNSHFNEEPSSAIVVTAGQPESRSRTMYWPLCLISTEDELIIRMNSFTNSASFVASRGDPLGQLKKIIDYVLSLSP
ncbi:hypothetical protein AAHA92_32974 [Salvia divinorum]|uniref:Uncharacterized protein n=1 Tax=Salvia divinorum TaxID=28513 RepID=A0ABD1FNF2_SALDI